MSRGPRETPLHSSSSVDQLSPGVILRIGRWHVDPRADEIAAEGRTVKLEPRKMRLLMALAERPGQVVLTQELLDTVWAGLVVTSGSVYQGIAELRRLLGDNGGAPYIETVPRKGYRLVAAVQRLLSDAASAPPGRPLDGETAGGEEQTGASDESVPAAAGRRPAAEASVDAPAVEAPAAGAPAAEAAAEAPAAKAAAAAAAVAVSASAVAAVPLIPSAAPAASPPRVSRRRWLLGATSTVAAAGAGLAVWRFLDSRPPVTPVRIAVLPFGDQSRGGVEQALSQGLAFDIIRALERHPQIAVVASESVLAIGGGAGRVEEAARRLGVGFVLLGELLRSGRQVRLAVQLLALPGQHVRWRHAFEQAFEGVSLLPRFIAAEAIAALKLPPAPPETSTAGPSEAFELYVLGDNAWRAKTPEAVAKARDYFERGIALDPDYARNYVGLGWMWIAQASLAAGIDRNEGFARATPLFDKALRLDPQSAEALTAQGVLKSSIALYDDARALFDQAVALNPGYAQAHHSRGVAEYDDGWPQRAVPHFRRAAELNPLSLSPHERLGLAHVASGQFAAAEAAYRRAVALEPQHPNGHWGLGIQAYAQGAPAIAVQHYRDALQREARRPFLCYELAWLYLDLNLPEPAAAAFGQTVALLPATSRWTAVHAAYAWLAKPDRGPPPAALALSAGQVPEDFSAIDVMLLRTLAGLPVDDALLQRALDNLSSVRDDLQPLLWFVFQGRHALIDLATVYAALGQPERGLPYLERAEQQLDRYRRQGNVWHALHFHRARILGLRGDRDAALAELIAAVDAGCRRGWWLRLDPAFAGLREQPRFVATLARIDAETARQRGLLKS